MFEVYTPTGNRVGMPSRLSSWAGRDRHKEAREKTRREGKPASLFAVQSVLQSLRGRPAREVMKYSAIQTLGYDKSILIPDLNLYRPGVNLKAMKEEMGIEHIILRMGGPRQFVFDNWLLTEDPTWRGYFNDAVKYGYKSIGGYFVYSAGIDAMDYRNSEILLRFIKEITSQGYLPDYIIADDEVNTWYESGRTVTATSVNQVAGLQHLFPKIWSTFKKPAMHYSARWFLNNYYEGYSVMLDNLNKEAATKGVMGKQVLNWYAWYLNDFAGKPDVYTSDDAVLGKIPLPTSTQQNAYLSLGNWNLYDLHQFTSTLVTPYYKNPQTGQQAGVDFSVSRYSEAEFMAAINKQTAPPPPPPPPPPADDLPQRVAALETQLGRVVSWADSFTK